MEFDIQLRMDDEDDSNSSDTETRPNKIKTLRFDYTESDNRPKCLKDIKYTVRSLRKQAPVLTTLFSEYKKKWDKSQRRRIDRYNRIAADDSDCFTDTSNGTVTSKIEFGYPNAEIDDDETNFEPADNEPFRAGYYLLISYEKGGWTYPEVKRYFWQQHGVRCFRSKSVNEFYKGTKKYRALIKFRNQKALDDVCKILEEERR